MRKYLCLLLISIALIAGAKGFGGGHARGYSYSSTRSSYSYSRSPARSYTPPRQYVATRSYVRNGNFYGNRYQPTRHVSYSGRTYSNNVVIYNGHPTYSHWYYFGMYHPLATPVVVPVVVTTPNVVQPVVVQTGVGTVLLKLLFFVATFCGLVYIVRRLNK